MCVRALHLDARHVFVVQQEPDGAFQRREVERRPLVVPTVTIMIVVASAVIGDGDGASIHNRKADTELLQPPHTYTQIGNTIDMQKTYRSHTSSASRTLRPRSKIAEAWRTAPPHKNCSCACFEYMIEWAVKCKLERAKAESHD